MPKDWRLFNEVIGLPKNPMTNQPGRLLSYQDDIGTYRGKDLLVVKANKIGVTEAILRRIIWRSTVGDCRGYQVMLGAQNRELAKENIRRLQAIFNGSSLLHSLVLDMTKTRLMLRDGTTYMIMPRTASAIRGWPRLKIIYLDEAAHYGLLDDEEILAASISRLTNTEGDLIAASTPKGQRGFFYRRYMEAERGVGSTKVMNLPYHVALGRLVSQEYIDEMKLKLGPLFSQEYECAFLSSLNAAIEAGLVDKNVGDYPADNW